MAHLVLPNGKGHGWKPDTPDHRDAPKSMRVMLDQGRFSRKSITGPIYLNEKYIPRVRDQANLGACTGFGTTGALMYTMRSKRVPNALSPMFAYYNGRVVEGSVNEDSGCEIRDVVKEAARLGVAPETSYTYKPSNFKRKPSERAYERALSHQIKAGYHRCNGIDDILQGLANDLPAVGGFSCFSSLGQADNTGRVPLPNPEDRLEGGHCVWFVGADPEKRFLKFQNSWGEWGDQGYGYLPFEYVTQGLADDFWIIAHE